MQQQLYNWFPRCVPTLSMDNVVASLPTTLAKSLFMIYGTEMSGGALECMRGYSGIRRICADLVALCAISMVMSTEPNTNPAVAAPTSYMKECDTKMTIAAKPALAPEAAQITEPTKHVKSMRWLQRSHRSIIQKG